MYVAREPDAVEWVDVVYGVLMGSVCVCGGLVGLDRNSVTLIVFIPIGGSNTRSEPTRMALVSHC